MFVIASASNHDLETYIYIYIVDWLGRILHSNVFNHLKAKSLPTADSNKIKIVLELRKREHFEQISMAPEDTERKLEKVFHLGVKGGNKNNVRKHTVRV